MKATKENFYILILKENSETLLSEDLVTDGFYTILFTSKGSIKIKIGEFQKTLFARELIVISKRVNFNISPSEKIFHAYIILFSPELILSTKNNIYKVAHFKHLQTQGFTSTNISAEDFPLLNKTLKLLYLAQKSNSLQLQKEIFEFGFNFLIQNLINSFYDLSEKNYSHKEKIFFKFTKLLSQKYKDEKSVQYYAETLCISKGYLNKVVKEVTNKTTKMLINDMIIIEAKILLHSYHQPITEIAEELNFSSAASFSNFFKKHTTLPPTVYRKISQK